MKKRNKKELSLTILLLIGVLISVGTVVCASLILSLIASLTKDPASLIGIFSLLSLLLAGALSGFAITKLFAESGSLIAFLSSIIAALVMSVIGLIVKGGAVPISVFLNYLAYVGIAALFAFLATRKVKRKRRYN